MELFKSASRYRLLLAVYITALARAATQLPSPVALVAQAPPDARIRRAESQTTLPTYLGDLLFPGDTLIASHGSVRIAFCPNSTSYLLSGGELRVESTRVTPLGKDTAFSTVATIPCRLPVVSPGTYRDVRSGADRLQQAATPPQPPESKPPLTAVQQLELQRLDALVTQNPGDITALLARSIALEGANDFNAAARDYQTISKLAPHADWVPNEMRAVLARRDRMASGAGKVIAVIVGISDYLNLNPAEHLQFADRDAASFYDFLVSSRGGARPADVTLLTNSKAKLADMTLAIDEAFARARPQDEVIIFLAAHGVPVADGDNAGAYIMAYDSNQEEPSSMYGMAKLQEVTDDRLRPQRVQLFADTCHAGFIGGTDTRRENLFLADFLSKRRATTKVLGLLASGTNESSYECSNLDQGHGAFSYFLVSGLSSNAAVDEQVQQVTVYSLYEYIRDNVKAYTKGLKTRQTPEKRSANMDDSEVLVHVDLPALPAASAPTSPAPRAVCDGVRGLTAPHQPGRMSAGLLDSNQQAIAAQLNSGQEVILRYLKGEQVAMTRQDFQRGETFFAAASQLEGGANPFTEARLLFCRGRRLIFEKNYPAAIGALEGAIRIDQFGAYSYNALGIAFLETADFDHAIAAFRDAIRLAPRWAYARHNLGLAYAQNGQYDQAIAAYREAMRLGRGYLYIPFNLGLLYQRLNRPREARALWEDVLQASPKFAKAENALGLSYALEGRSKKAEATYRDALGMANEQVDRLAVRHNLALLLDGQNRSAEALQLWRANLDENKDDLPTLTGLSAALSRSGDIAGAGKVFEKLLDLKPGYVGGRLEYARLLQKAGKGQEAATQLTEVLKLSPANSDACEMLGDLRAAVDKQAALALYSRALTAPTLVNSASVSNRSCAPSISPNATL